ncbi:putative uncharacterized protein [Streptomyces azureus]|uniref:Uncharacterized protein n=2 Tax=Streptomyces azureus TaxID=146537 RepID=A0A0K8PW49_STRAJ|nr:putative uncharacterized protein [Streptomyces azureus]
MGPRHRSPPPAIHLHESHSREPSDDPGTKALRDDFPAPVPAAGVTYPSVAHAYWALSTTDPDARPPSGTRTPFTPPGTRQPVLPVATGGNGPGPPS